MELNCTVMTGYENHLMTYVQRFGTWEYCGYNNYRLPIELKLGKTARGSADEDTCDMDLRIWVKNNATPTYCSREVGFRCANGGE
jgi:hypothetical protein